MILTPRQPYDFRLLLAILSRYPAPSDFHLDGQRLLRAVQSDDGIALVALSSPQEIINVEPLIGQISESRLRHLYGIDRDQSAFYAYAQSQPQLWQVIEPLIGLPLYCDDTIFQSLVFTIIEQHISWVAAQNAQRRLVEWGNQHVIYQDTIFYAFPTAQRLAQATVADLKPLKITDTRARLIIQLAEQVSNGTLQLESWMQESTETMYRELCKIKGIGHWTASVVIARTRATFPYIPHNDVAVQAAVNHYFYGLTGRCTGQQMIKTFEAFGEYAGTVAHYTLMRWVLDRYPIQAEKS